MLHNYHWHSRSDGEIEIGPAATNWKGNPYGSNSGLYCDYAVNPTGTSVVDGSLHEPTTCSLLPGALSLSL